MASCRSDSVDTDEGAGANGDNANVDKGRQPNTIVGDEQVSPFFAVFPFLQQYSSD